MDKYEERLRTQALEQRQFSDDYGCVHDAAPSQSQLDLRALLADLDRLRADLAESDRIEAEAIGERDRFADALAQAHINLGGDGEWACRIPQPDPPGTGQLDRDVPALATRLRADLEAAREALEDSRKFTKSIYDFRVRLNDDDEPDVSDSGTPFGVCDYYAMDDLMNRQDAALARLGGRDDAS